MPRPILDEDHIHPAIRGRISTHQQAILNEVRSAVLGNDVVVVGMGMNPFPARARKALEADPGNVYLNSHLAATRRRKLELLRQATALAHSES